jgi:hypothetical protein
MLTSRPQLSPDGGKPPAWNENQGILSRDGVVIKRFDKPAENQRAILRAFERQGWPDWIADPLERDAHMDERQRLADAVYHLNLRQEHNLIRFRRDGRGMGVIWEWVPKKKKKKRRKKKR